MNGIPFLDSIPVNWFILGTSVLAGVILFLILTQIPDEEDPKEVNKKPQSETIIEAEEVTVTESRPTHKKKSTRK